MGWFKWKGSKDERPPEARRRERELLEGFAARDPSAERGLVVALRPLLRRRFRKRWPELWHDWPEVEARSLERLVLWRHKGLLRVDDPLPFLARRLVEQEMRQHLADGETARRQDAAVDSIPEPPQADQLKDSLRLVERVWALARARLSPEQLLALTAGAAAAEGLGPSVGVALGMDEKVAEQRVRRARAALLRVATEAGLLADVHWEGTGEAVYYDRDDEGGEEADHG